MQISARFFCFVHDIHGVAAPLKVYRDFSCNRVVFTFVRFKAVKVGSDAFQNILYIRHGFFGGIIHQAGQFALISNFGYLTARIRVFKLEQLRFIIHTKPCEIGIAYVVFRGDFILISRVCENTPRLHVFRVYKFGIINETRRSPHISSRVI